MADSNLTYEGIKTLDQIYDNTMPFVICNQFTNKDLTKSIHEFLIHISIGFQGINSNGDQILSDQKLYDLSNKLLHLLEDNSSSLKELEIANSTQISLATKFLDNIKNSEIHNLTNLDPHHLEELNRITFSIITNRFFR